MYHDWWCTLINRPLSYPFRFLIWLLLDLVWNTRREVLYLMNISIKNWSTFKKQNFFVIMVVMSASMSVSNDNRDCSRYKRPNDLKLSVFSIIKSSYWLHFFQWWFCNLVLKGKYFGNLIDRFIFLTTNNILEFSNR